MLEEHNPDVNFDWPRLLKSGSTAPTPAGADPAGPAVGSSGDDRRRDRRDPRRPRGGGPRAEPPMHPEPLTTATTQSPEPEPDEPAEPGKPAEPGEPVEPSLPLEPRFARLGAEGLQRLRARYANMRARVESTADQAGQAELLARLERLNPDAWHSEEEVAHALEEYEAVSESLRPFIGRQPRPRRL